MIKLVGFDWNGTILADAAAAVRAENVVLKHLGLPPTNLKRFSSLFTIPIKEYWVKMGVTPEQFEKETYALNYLFLESYEPSERVCRSRAGTRDVLVWLKRRKIKSVIYSNHIVPHIEKQLKRLKLYSFFDQIIARGSRDDYSHLHNRSKGDKLKAYVEKNKYDPGEVVTVGDTIEEVEIAKDYNFISAALTGGYNSEKRLRAAEPDFLLHNMIDLKAKIREINNH